VSRAAAAASPAVAVEARANGTGPASRRPSRWTLVTLFVVVVVAGWLRFASLGRLSFWSDEFPHAVAARSLIEQHRPVLPSGIEYRRALAQSVTVAASMRAFGENESAARAPSAIVGLLTVPLVWLAMRRRFGEAAALAAAAVVAVMPLQVAHSRSARFYAAFVLAYGVSAVLGSRAIATRSRRTGMLAVGAFAIAVHLQIAAAMLLAPLAVYGVLAWRSAPAGERPGRARALLALAVVGVIAGALLIAVPATREGAGRLIERPVPGLELDPGLHLATLGRLFGLIAWWAWIPLLPAAFVGLRRAGIEGWNLLIQLALPAILLAVLFRPEEGSGFDRRYLIHLAPFLAAVVGIGVSELVRLVASGKEALAMPGTAVLGAAIVAGVFGVASLPGAPHPGQVIHRPNWDAAASIVRAQEQPGDALLSTGPLAVYWTVGRCGDWLRNAKAAAPFMIGRRDVYCGSALIPDAAATDAYFDAHSTGWVVAEPASWERYVDPGSRAVIERRARRVDAGDSSILLWRWG